MYLLHSRHPFLRQVRVRRGAQRGLGQQERGRGDGRGEKAGGEQVVENKNYGDKIAPYISAQVRRMRGVNAETQ